MVYDSFDKEHFDQSNRNNKYVFETFFPWYWITRLHLHVIVVTKNVPNVKNFSFGSPFPSNQYLLSPFNYVLELLTHTLFFSQDMMMV